MRTTRYNVAATLDGFIAGPGGEYDWIPEEPEIDFTAIFAQYDTLVMGRKTYEVTNAQHGWMFDGMRVAVISTTLDPAEHDKVEIVRSDPEGHVRALKAQPGKDIWIFGGGELFRTLLDAGLVDEVEIAICPVLLGSGVPVIPPGALKKLVHRDTHTYKTSGIVMVRYGVER